MSRTLKKIIFLSFEASLSLFLDVSTYIIQFLRVKRIKNQHSIAACQKYIYRRVRRTETKALAVPATISPLFVVARIHTLLFITVKGRYDLRQNFDTTPNGTKTKQTNKYKTLTTTARPCV